MISQDRRIARLVAWCVLRYLPSNAKFLLIKDLREKKEREISPNLSLQSSDHYMNRAGFSGIDVEVHDCDDNFQYSSSLSISTVNSVEQLYYPPEVVIVLSEAHREIQWLGNISNATEKLTSKLLETSSRNRADAREKSGVLLTAQQQSRRILWE